MAKDYYLILGVPLDAAPAEIRSAFRKLALRHHPDRHDQPSSREFRRISEAYDVLSDPDRRARYDRTLHDGPLVSEPVPVAEPSAPIRPSYDALLDRVARNFFALDLPKAEHEEPLHFELILTPLEAERGVLIPFQVPVFSACHHCGGFGREGVLACSECEGTGRRTGREVVKVRVPRGVRDGTVFDVSLEELGIRNLWLRVRVRVEWH